MVTSFLPSPTVGLSVVVVSVTSLLPASKHHDNNNKTLPSLFLIPPPPRTMTGDLINLDDDNTISPIAPAFIGNKMAANHPKSRTVSRDSFSDLTDLMKAKKPYVPIPPPALRSLPLSSVPNSQ
jgi:hypothetical protein